MSRPGRILYVVGGFGIGGTERHLSLVLPSMADLGWDLHVASLSEDGPMSIPVRERGIPISEIRTKTISIPKFGGIASLIGQISQVASLIMRLKPDIVHCLLSIPCIVGGLATFSIRARGVRPRLVLSKRNQLVRPSHFIGDRWLERFVLRHADGIVAPSSVVRNELSSLNIQPDRIHLLHNGVPALAPVTAQDRTSLRRSEGLGDDEIIMAVTANTIPYKGHADLFAALARSSTQLGDGWKLLLIGSGNEEYTRHLADLAQFHGISPHVRWLGFRPDVGRLLPCADIGILASHHEGFSNALLEYMSAGLPVIATNVGGNVDAVLHGVTGLLVPPSSPPDLAKAIADLASDASRRRAMGQAGLRHYEQYFSLDRCIAAYDDLYRNMLQGRPI